MKMSCSLLCAYEKGLNDVETNLWVSVGYVDERRRKESELRLSENEMKCSMSLLLPWLSFVMSIKIYDISIRIKM